MSKNQAANEVKYKVTVKLLDIICQNIIKGALEPQWEARFEPVSYGFRPKRGCHDAISRIFLSCRRGTNKRWIFEGDFKGCFDNLNHGYILEQIKEFPYAELIWRCNGRCCRE